jgi:hypothetical protein
VGKQEKHAAEKQPRNRQADCKPESTKSRITENYQKQEKSDREYTTQKHNTIYFSTWNIRKLFSSARSRHARHLQYAGIVLVPWNDRFPPPTVSRWHRRTSNSLQKYAGRLSNRMMRLTDDMHVLLTERTPRSRYHQSRVKRTILLMTKGAVPP